MKMNKKYKYFDFSEIFEYQRGRRLTVQNQVLGNIAYISSSAINNGIDNYITPPEYMEIHQNKMTLSNSGSVGCLFYHDYKFVASDHVTVIWIKGRELNKYLAIFLKPIFEKIKYRYNFGREISNKRLKYEKLYLPINENKNPDFDYMEAYIKELENKIRFKKISTKNKTTNQVINMKDWKEFDINDLFKIKGSSSISIEELNKKYDFGEYPYVTRTEKNNGITGFYDYKTVIANVLTIETTLSGLCFYHDYEFSTGDHIAILRPKNFKLNKYIALFIKTIWRKNSYKYTYGRPAIIENIKQTKLLLPATKDGKPDFEFMENYIKSLPYGDKI